MILSLNKYNPKDYPVIAIDLDDTIWSSHNPDGTHIFPNAGMPYKNAIKTINNMICAGYEVIIWTARDSAEQATACKKRLLEAGINPNFKWNWYSNRSSAQFVVNKSSSPKIDANVFIDDRAYGAPVYNDDTWQKIGLEFCGK